MWPKRSAKILSLLSMVIRFQIWPPPHTHIHTPSHTGGGGSNASALSPDFTCTPKYANLCKFLQIYMKGLNYLITLFNWGTRRGGKWGFGLFSAYQGLHSFWKHGGITTKLCAWGRGRSKSNGATWWSGISRIRLESTFLGATPQVSEGPGKGRIRSLKAARTLKRKIPQVLVFGGWNTHELMRLIC